MIINFPKKKLFLLICIFCMMLFSQSFTAAGFTTSGNNQSFANKQSSKLLQPSTKKMMATIKDLSTNSREYGTNNEKKACIYLKNKFKSYAYEPSIQIEEHLDWTGTIKSQGRNIIAVKKNTTKTRKGIIVICAHYDCSKYSLGANDDASGCAVVLETARLLKDAPSAYEVRFILFCGEEKGCLGSLYYVQKLSKNDIKNMKAVLDIDSIAQKDYVKPGIFTVSGKENTATALLKNAKENKTLTITKMTRERSDYTVFDYYNMPALCIGQPYTNKLKINNDKDQASRIDKSKLEYVANILLNALR